MPQKIKIILLSIIAVIIIGLVSFGTYWKIKEIKQKKAAETGGQNQPVLERVDSKSVPVNLADCDKYDEGEIDSCFFGMAHLSNDDKICEKIRNEDKKGECKEKFIYDKIIEEENINKCSDLKYLKAACYMDMFRRWDKIGKCDNIPEDMKESCRNIINNSLAYANKDPEYCKKINDEAIREGCKSIISNIPLDTDSDGITDEQEMAYGTNTRLKDTDNDGLSDLDELSKYLTNPKKADTDGDGYSDGDEVKNGFNPSGEGKLENK